MEIREFIRIVTQDVDLFGSFFDNTVIGSVDRCYNSVIAIINLISFDYYLILKKFDPYMPERNFKYQPHFGAVRGDSLPGALKDFLETAYIADPDKNWDIPIKILKAYMGDIEVIPPNKWKDLQSYLQDLRNTNILELIIRHTEQNPNWKLELRKHDEHAAQGWLLSKQDEIKNAIGAAVRNKRNNQISALAISIFGSSNPVRLNYYTEKKGEPCVQKKFEGFIYAACLSYIKAFLTDYFAKDIRELCEILLIRGQWVELSMSMQLSEDYHSLNGFDQRLTAFDESVSESGIYGAPLFEALPKAERERHLARQITLLLKDINGEALELINSAAQSFTVIARYLKDAKDDYAKEFHDLIVNWSELEQETEEPITNRIAEAYNKIYALNQIIMISTRMEVE
jgi:hypothetical protein